MTFSLDDLAFLTSARGKALLEILRGEDLRDSALLGVITGLRKQYTGDEARAAVELARLRAQAVDKFGEDAGKMYFTREALEQASDPLIRRYRSHISFSAELIDIGCSIGSDSLAFASGGKYVTGIDLDPVRIEMARLNAAALGINQAKFVVADAREYMPPETSVIFFDPGRRDALGNRIANVERYSPPLSIIRRWKLKGGRVMVKLSPGVDIDELEKYPGTLQFVSVSGDLKEAILYYDPDERKLNLAATLITPTDTFYWDAVPSYSDRRPISKPRQWLIEPDPALLRAVKVESAAAQWKAYQLDTTIAYLTAEKAPETPWARSWRILDWMPFSVKRLRAYLRDHNVGTVTVKKRGSAVTPETLIPQLKLNGDESRVIVLTRSQGDPIAIVCDDYQPQHDSRKE